MFGLLALAVLVLVLTPSKSEPKLPTSEPCEIWITFNDRSIAICGSGTTWQLLDGATDQLRPRKHREIVQAVGEAVELLGITGAKPSDVELLVVSGPASRAEIRPGFDSNGGFTGWLWTVELADGGIKNGESPESLLDAIGDVYAAAGSNLA